VVKQLAALLVLVLPALPGTTSASSLQTGIVHDSIDVLHQAHAAQREFERTRRANLPGETGGGRACDERIGRFCYWYEPFSDPSLTESGVVRAARGDLIRALENAAGQLPGDGWIVGQLVRYLVEQGAADSAIAAARRCRAARWWCSALEGFARHMAHDYAGADSAFAQAVRQMPEPERCDWTDLAPLLGEEAREYRSVGCNERDSLNERLWWLARPLYSRPGNDLRTEHYARHTMGLLLADAATPDGIPWGADRRELVVRFGWPVRWSRPWNRPGEVSPRGILGHEPGPSFWFFPEPAITQPWDDPTVVQWNPERERPPARYAPPYATGFSRIDDVQFARFSRGDTTLNVAAFDLTADSVLGDHPADTRLAVAQDPSTPIVVAPVSALGRSGALTLRSLWRPAVLSLEAVGVDTPWVARRRTVTAPDPGGLPPLLSDLLLFVPGDLLPKYLEGALATALPAPTVRRSRPTGLYWETYGKTDSSVTVELAVSNIKPKDKNEPPYPVGRPFCPFAASAHSPVRLRWVEDPATRPSGIGRSVVLDLHTVSPGRALVTLQTSVAGRVRGCSSREIQIVK
jgi:hypothetical protein